MFNKKYLITIFLILSVIYFVTIFYYYSLMPEQIASHFGLDGRADGFSSKRSFITFSVVLYAFISVLFLGLGLMVKKVPAAVLNIPKKEILLNEKNRETTYRKVSTFLLLFANMTLLLFIIVDFFVFKANTDGTMKLFPIFWVILITYLVMTVTAALLMNRDLLRGIEK